MHLSPLNVRRHIVSSLHHTRERFPARYQSRSAQFGISCLTVYSLLMKDLVKSLDNSCGLSSHYQAVVSEQHSLDNTRLEIELVFLSCHASSQLASLRETALNIVMRYGNCVTAFRNRVRSYRVGLQCEDSRSLDTPRCSSNGVQQKKILCPSFAAL